MNKKNKLSEIKSPKNIPVAVYIQEAETLHHVCIDDIEMLTASGLDRNLIDEMPARCKALSEAEAIWNTIRRRQSETENEWTIKSGRGFELRNELVHNYRFAYSESHHVRMQIKNSLKKNSIAALVQQLTDLPLIGRDDPEPLKKTGFDLSLLDESAALSDTLSELYGKVISEREKQKDYLKIRNQAYTHLKEAVDEVRRHGRFLFKKDKARKRAYSSEYTRLKNAKYRKTAETD